MVGEMSDQSLFDRVGDRYVPTELSRGPWDPRHCHGGPVAALLARAVEHADDLGPWQVARLTIELTRPVPVRQPLTLAVDVERPGRKVSLVAGVLRDGDTEVARVRALRIRDAAIELPSSDPAMTGPAVDAPMAPPDAGRRERSNWPFGAEDRIAFHSHGCEHRFVDGSWVQPGPVAVWIRLLHPVLAGETPSGVQRAAAAADFGNGVSGALPADRFVYINPDLTVHLARPPEGEWIGMRSASHYGHAGAGLAESALFDERGRLGRSCQSLFVDPR